jgi:hypothetical protein
MNIGKYSVSFLLFCTILFAGCGGSGSKSDKYQKILDRFEEPSGEVSKLNEGNVGGVVASGSNEYGDFGKVNGSLKLDQYGSNSKTGQLISALTHSIYGHVHGAAETDLPDDNTDMTASEEEFEYDFQACTTWSKAPKESKSGSASGTISFAGCPETGLSGGADIWVSWDVKDSHVEIMFEFIFNKVSSTEHEDASFTMDGILGFYLDAELDKNGDLISGDMVYNMDLKVNEIEAKFGARFEISEGGQKESVEMLVGTTEFGEFAVKISGSESSGTITIKGKDGYITCSFTDQGDSGECVDKSGKTFTYGETS